jgi:hypothetical protein
MANPIYSMIFVPASLAIRAYFKITILFDFKVRYPEINEHAHKISDLI